MKTYEYLFVEGAYWPAVVTAVAVAIPAAVLSVVVVLKRLAFIGQGISHAAFGGVGIAAVLGLAGASAAGGLGMLGVVAAFCVAAALGIAWLSDRGRVHTDTAIGIVLAVAMAVGFLLHRQAGMMAAEAGRARPPALESVLFGNVITVRWSDAYLAVVVGAVVLATLWWWRRPMLFWAFDESASEAFGVRAGAAKRVLLVVLALTVVLVMKLAGVVLATALLVLPGAIALRMSDRLRTVGVIAVIAGVVGVVGGLVVSFELDWQTGPSIVLALAGLYVPARVLGRAGT